MQTQQAYLMATSIEHCMSVTRQPFNLDVIENVNTIVVLDNEERTVMLASVTPPDEKVVVHLNGIDHNITVQSLFNTIQTQAVAWCNI